MKKKGNGELMMMMIIICMLNEERENILSPHFSTTVSYTVIIIQEESVNILGTIIRV